MYFIKKLKLPRGFLGDNKKYISLLDNRKENFVWYQVLDLLQIITICNWDVDLTFGNLYGKNQISSHPTGSGAPSGYYEMVFVITEKASR